MHIFVQIHPRSGDCLPQSFESLAEVLGSLPGMYFEMDGSFVWVDHETEPASQMDGMVYDRQDKLAYVEIKGECSVKQWRTLCLAVCGLAVPVNGILLQSEEDSSYTAIDRIARVHRVAEGDWTSANAITNLLQRI